MIFLLTLKRHLTKIFILFFERGNYLVWNSTRHRVLISLKLFLFTAPFRSLFFFFLYPDTKNHQVWCDTRTDHFFFVCAIVWSSLGCSRFEAFYLPFDGFEHMFFLFVFTFLSFCVCVRACSWPGSVGVLHDQIERARKKEGGGATVDKKSESITDTLDSLPL